MTEVKNIPKRRWLWRLGLVGLLAVVLFGDVGVSKLVFHRLCATEGGEEIHQTIDGVEGVLIEQGRDSGCNATCKSLLGTNGYRFVEARVDRPDVQFLTSTPGYYRFFLAERDRKECAAYDRAFENNPSYRRMTEQRFGLPSSMCIASVQVTQLTSEYAYTSTLEYDYVKAPRIAKLASTITEIKTGNVLATSTGFSRLRASGWLGRISGMDPGNQTCHSPDGLLVVKTLKPSGS